jgi:hypothetical protein
MGMPNGRAYIHELLLRCHVFSQPFAANALLTAFACGELNIGQSMLADIMRDCPDEYILMMREANGRDIAADTRLRRSDEDADRGDSGATIYKHPALDTFRDDRETTSDAQSGFGRDEGEE